MEAALSEIRAAARDLLGDRLEFSPERLIELIEDRTSARTDALDARNPGKGFGTKIANNWYWYESWRDKVLEKLAEGWTRPAK
ncbi:hypothetical protein [Mesorhizobium sp. M0578]|uniref:hypothetical protein n=1 Tax=unclassified Mesorhizobium TaxID=325217 RepID=UPI00333DCF61